MGVTNPRVSPYQGMSMFLVPTDTPGVEIARNVGRYGEPDNASLHALVRYDNVRVPAQALLGGEGQAFVIAQTRLGGGRIHHAMRTIGMARAAHRLSKHLRGTHVTVLINDRDNRVLDRTTGTLIRKLVLDPNRDYQPLGVKCGNLPENRMQV